MVRSETNAYIEKMFEEHPRVSNYVKVSNTTYTIEREDFSDNLRVYIDDTYLLTQHGVEEILDDDSEVNCIVMSSSWLKYSSEAKTFAVDSEMGLFTMGELYGALFQSDFWSFVKKER